VTIDSAFARQAFDRAGEFVSFDRGWHSDGASWPLFSAAHGTEPVSVWLQMVWPLSCRIEKYTDHSVLSELLLCVKWRI